jgi:hypothetical protein
LSGGLPRDDASGGKSMCFQSQFPHKSVNLGRIPNKNTFNSAEIIERRIDLCPEASSRGRHGIGATRDRDSPKIQQLKETYFDLFLVHVLFNRTEMAKTLWRKTAAPVQVNLHRSIN